MVKTGKFGLVHYSIADDELTLISRGEAAVRDGGRCKRHDELPHLAWYTTSSDFSTPTACNDEGRPVLGLATDAKRALAS
jgi:hypothetical protein